jgi:hypothetical protein
MKRLSLLALFVLIAGCDTVADRLPHAELFVGQWNMTRIQDAQGDRTNEFAAAGTLSAEFSDAGQYTLAFTAVAEDLEDMLVTGTYQVFENDGVLRIFVTGEGFTAPVDLGYQFRSNNTVELTIEAHILGAVLDVADYTGQVRLTLQRA